MNWWILAGSLMALICAVGHAVAGWSMFYRPIRGAITSDLHAGVFAGMWHLITINFTLSALALLVLGACARHDAAAWLIAAQFGGYAATYLVISMRLGGAWTLFQWLPLPQPRFWSQGELWPSTEGGSLSSAKWHASIDFCHQVGSQKIMYTRWSSSR